MFHPCIVILRHQPSLYEWAMMYGQEKMDSDIGDTSVSDCLVAALDRLPDNVSLVEIRYRGMHMGTYERRLIDGCPGEIAAIISETYGVLRYHT